MCGTVTGPAHEHRKVVHARKLEVLGATARSDVDDAGPLVHRHVIPRDHPVDDALDSGQVIEGLNLVPNSLVLPHHNTFGKSWASRLLEISQVTLIGIDEGTGMIDDGVGTWTVYGAGDVTLYRNQEVEIYPTGRSFSV